MGKIDDPHDAKDEAQAYAHEAVDGADDDAGRKGLQMLSREKSAPMARRQMPGYDFGHTGAAVAASGG